MKVCYVEDKKVDYSKLLLNLGYSSGQRVGLENGREYSVYGIVIFKQVIHYLLLPSSNELPNWYPANYFSISDNLIPSNWFFQKYPDEDISGYQMILGYKEMVDNNNHIISLIEREIESMKIFKQRKKEHDDSEKMLT